MFSLGIKLLPYPFLFEYFSLVVILALLFASTFFVRTLQPARKYAGVILLLAPACYFYWIIHLHTINVPYIDDWDLLESIYGLTRDVGLLEKTKFLFSQINQHRFAYERIIMWLILVITGSENIKIQIVIGNAFLIGILYLFYKTLRREGISWYYMIPACFILFNLVYYENANWGIAALQNTSLLFFALLAAYAIGSTDNKSWYLALFSAIIATFTSGSGLLTWLICAPILLLQKKYKRLAIWCGTALCVFLFYFLFDYHFIRSDAESPLTHPIYNLGFLLAFWGNALFLNKPHPVISGNYYDIAACVALGFSVGIVFCIWLYRMFRYPGNWKTYSFIVGAFMFVMGTGAMLVLSRPIAFSVTYGGELLSRRYMIFGIITLLTAYTALVIVTKTLRKLQITLGICALVFGVGLNFTSYFMSLSQVRRQYETLALDGLYWKNYGMMMSFGNLFEEKLFWNHPTRMTTLISNLDKSGIYLFPSASIPVLSPLAGGSVVEREKFTGRFEFTAVPKYNQWLHRPVRFIDMTYTVAPGSGFIPVYIQLKSATHLFVFPACPVPNSLAGFLSHRAYYSDKYQYSFFASKFLPGSYEVWIVGKDGSNANSPWKSQYSGQKIQL